MPRPSKIDRLPAEVREAIGRLRRDGRTIDEILGKLRELTPEEVSRSALGRHVQRIDQVAAQIQQSRAVAEAVVDRFGDAPESKIARVNIEMMHGVVMKLMVGEDGGAMTLDPQEAMFVATSLQKLASASKLDVEREVKIRAAVKAEIASKAASAATAASGTLRKAGLSADTIRTIETEILGIVR